MVVATEAEGAAAAAAAAATSDRGAASSAASDSSSATVLLEDRLARGDANGAGDVGSLRSGRAMRNRSRFDSLLVR